VIEAKASPPVEPLRDPEKAYVKIRDAFRSKRGIQKAFEQGNRIRRAVLSREHVVLHDKRGNVLREIDASQIDEVYCICVTADDFGLLAANLELLLEKEPDDAYPWAVCVLSLEPFLGAFKRRGWGGDELDRFLAERRELHGRVITSDELEVGGYFIQNGSLRTLIDREYDLLVLTHDFAEIFDELYVEEHGGSPASLGDVRPTHFVDLREILEDHISPREVYPVQQKWPGDIRSADSDRQRIGRNVTDKRFVSDDVPTVVGSDGGPAGIRS
jgi:hypothetical protein